MLRTFCYLQIFTREALSQPFLLEYGFYSEKCRIILKTVPGCPAPPALGVTRNQSSSSTSIALRIQESKVMWSSWCPLDSFSLHSQQKKQLEKRTILFPSTATELL